MPFSLDISLPPGWQAVAKETLLWEQVKDYSAAKLLKLVMKFVRSKGYSITFVDIDEEVLGRNWVPEHKIHISSTALNFAQMPSVIIHECLHSIFSDIDSEEPIYEFEIRIMKHITVKQVNLLLKTVFKKANWKFKGPLLRRVESPAEIKPMTVKRTRKKK